MKENEPQRYAQIGCVMMGHDYLRWCLTGVKGCEESNISESNLYNMTSGQYDPRLTQWLGIGEIDSALPPVVGSAEKGGEITPQAAAITGLAAGTPSSAACLMWSPPHSAPVLKMNSHSTR